MMWWRCMELLRTSLLSNTTTTLRKALRVSLFLYLSWMLLSSPSFNSPIFEVKTNYLHWSSTLPSFSVCQTYPSRNMSGLKGFLENLLRPKEKYCLNCKNTTNYPLNDYREITKMMTARCRQLFVECSWNRLKQDCCLVFKHLPTLDGACYTINSEMTGSRYKLEVSHYSKQGELFFTTTKDIQVYVHDPKEITVSESPSFTVRKNEKLDVIFRFRETVAEDSAKLLSYQTRRCILSTELSSYPLYSQSMCRLRCLAMEQARLCGCVHHLIPINVNVPDCNLAGLRCLDKKLGKKLERELQSKCHCLPSCEEMDISIVWHNISRISTKTREVKLSIISPPSEKGFLKSRYQLLDAIVLVACLSRLFTSISIYDVCKIWYIRKQQTFQKRKYTKNVNKYKIAYPIKFSNPDIANNINQRYRRSQSIAEPTVHYKLNLGGIDEYIDLIPNPHILSPDAVLEYRSNITSDIDPLINIKLGNFSLQECFFKGRVRNYEDSSTALSTCGGLCGFIRVKRRTYFIEPVNNQANVTNEEDLPHLIYEDYDIGKNPLNCATKQDYESSGNYIHNARHQSNREKLSNYDDLNVSTKPFHIETLLVLDKSMMDLHNQKDIQNYALTVFNMAQSLFHDLSNDPPVNLEVVRMIQVEDEKDHLNIRKKRQLGSIELKGFSEWQLRINPKEETHPNHHDLAILLTGNELCDDKDYCHYVGIAEFKGACRPKKQAAVCKDSGLMLGYIIAHEIAHTLGVGHDLGGNEGCKSQIVGGLSSVMSPVISFRPREWSDCSRMSLMSAIGKRQLRCLEDEPTTKVHVADILPGVLYDADYQCQQLLTMDAKSCNKQGDCQSLACEFEGASCSKLGVMPAPGTSCGENKWCYDGECLEAGKRPKALQGNWGPWSDWSPCSRTCGAGVATSTRECDSPSPLHGGKTCVGSRRRHKICTTQPCAIGSHPFRDVQCAEYNDWVFPEDGKMHNWKGFFISSGNPCALYCRNDRNVVVSVSPKVKDGTTCYRGIKDICVDGICRGIPCDLQFDSNSVEDACGVCHGNGTGCKVLHHHKDVDEGVSKIITIPMGTRNIIIEETSQIPSQFILKNHKTDNTIKDGKKLGMFNVPGGIAWLGMMKPNQEILEIPGPLMEPIDVWISSEGTQSVIYSMGLPSDLREGKYSWDYIDWSPCLAQCGDSIQESVPKCVELLSGRVEDKYCDDIEKPLIKTKYCNAGFCIPRWLVGEWQECGPCPNKEAKRFRLVRCIKPIEGSEDGIVIVEDKVCSGVRPIASEYCRCIKRQVGYWPSHFRSKTFSNDFSSLLSMRYNKGSKSTKSPEKKVTLMQLENENEESMLKQFKENQHKHHSLLYMPHLLGSRFNFSIPFKKRQIMENQTNFKDIVDYFNENIIKNIQYYPKYVPVDQMTIQRQEHNPNVSHSDNYFPFIGSRYPFSSFKKITFPEQTDHPPLNFSGPNILKLLSDNLPLEILKQQQESRENNDKSKSVKIQPNKFLINENFGQHKENGKIGILDLLINEFYNILAADAFIKANMTKPQKDNTNITTILGRANKHELVTDNRIFRNRYSYIGHNSCKITEPVSNREIIPNFHDLTQNECKYHDNETINILDGIMKVRANTFMKNNHGEIESNLYSNDNDWSSLLKTFFKHIVPKGLERQIVNISVPEQIFSAFPQVTELTTASAHNAQNEHDKESKTNVTLYSYPQLMNNKDNQFELLTKKVCDKLNSLNDGEKLKAYDFFIEIVNNLHQLLPALDGKHILHIYPGAGSNNDSTLEMDFEKNNEMQNVKYQNKNSWKSNYSRYRFPDVPFLPALYKVHSNFVLQKPLINNKSKFQLNSLLNQIRTMRGHEVSKKLTSTYNHVRKHAIKIRSLSHDIKNSSDNKYTTNPNNNSIISKFLSDLHKYHLENINVTKCDQQMRCKRAATHGRRITGVYSLPKDRICTTITPSPCRAKQYLRRCGRDSKGLTCKEIKSLEGEIIFHPQDIEIIELIGRIKRESHEEQKKNVCKQLMLQFKDTIINASSLNATMCAKMNEEIANVRKKIEIEEKLKSEMEEIRKTNCTGCYYIYQDDGMTTTPYVPQK